MSARHEMHVAEMHYIKKPTKTNLKRLAKRYNTFMDLDTKGFPRVIKESKYI